MLTGHVNDHICSSIQQQISFLSCFAFHTFKFKGKKSWNENWHRQKDLQIHWKWIIHIIIAKKYLSFECFPCRLFSHLNECNFSILHEMWLIFQHYLPDKIFWYTFFVAKNVKMVNLLCCKWSNYPYIHFEKKKWSMIQFAWGGKISN